jgi:hypothetical protein
VAPDLEIEYTPALKPGADFGDTLGAVRRSARSPPRSSATSRT